MHSSAALCCWSEQGMLISQLAAATCARAAEANVTAQQCYSITSCHKGIERAAQGKTSVSTKVGGGGIFTWFRRAPGCLVILSQQSVWQHYSKTEVPHCQVSRSGRQTQQVIKLRPAASSKTTSGVDQQAGAVRRADVQFEAAGKSSYQLSVKGCSTLCQRTATLRCYVHSHQLALRTNC